MSSSSAPSRSARASDWDSCRACPSSAADTRAVTTGSGAGAASTAGTSETVVVGLTALLVLGGRGPAPGRRGARPEPRPQSVSRFCPRRCSSALRLRAPGAGRDRATRAAWRPAARARLRLLRAPSYRWEPRARLGVPGCAGPPGLGDGRLWRGLAAACSAADEKENATPSAAAGLGAAGAAGDMLRSRGEVGRARLDGGCDRRDRSRCGGDGHGGGGRLHGGAPGEQRLHRGHERAEVDHVQRPAEALPLRLDESGSSSPWASERRARKISVSTADCEISSSSATSR